MATMWNNVIDQPCLSHKACLLVVISDIVFSKKFTLVFREKKWRKISILIIQMIHHDNVNQTVHIQTMTQHKIHRV